MYVFDTEDEAVAAQAALRLSGAQVSRVSLIPRLNIRTTGSTPTPRSGSIPKHCPDGISALEDRLTVLRIEHRLSDNVRGMGWYKLDMEVFELESFINILKGEIS